MATLEELKAQLATLTQRIQGTEKVDSCEKAVEELNDQITQDERALQRKKSRLTQLRADLNHAKRDLRGLDSGDAANGDVAPGLGPKHFTPCTSDDEPGKRHMSSSPASTIETAPLQTRRSAAASKPSSSGPNNSGSSDITLRALLERCSCIEQRPGGYYEVYCGLCGVNTPSHGTVGHEDNPYFNGESSLILHLASSVHKVPPEERKARVVWAPLSPEQIAKILGGQGTIAVVKKANPSSVNRLNVKSHFVDLNNSSRKRPAQDMEDDSDDDEPLLKRKFRGV